MFGESLGAPSVEAALANEIAMSRTGVFVGSLLGRASRAFAEASIVEEKNVRPEVYLHQKRPVEPVRDVARVAVAHEHGDPRLGAGGACR